MSIKVRHKRYGRGRLISFHPLLFMVIEFSNGNGKRDIHTISSTREHMEEVYLGDKKLSELVDLHDPVWYRDFLRTKDVTE